MHRISDLDPLSRDDEIMMALVGQVQQAADIHPRKAVRTLITRPMWRAFLRAMGESETLEPTPWTATGEFLGIFGSEAIVVESSVYAAASWRV